MNAYCTNIVAIIISNVLNCKLTIFRNIGTFQKHVFNLLIFEKTDISATFRAARCYNIFIVLNINRNNLQTYEKRVFGCDAMHI